MFISDFAIRRPVITVVCMIVLVTFGAFALWQSEVDEFPDIANPVVSVAIPYPGASPGQVESDVIEPIEEAVNGISGVDQITSTAVDGFARITVQFNFDVDNNVASQDVRDAVSEIRGQLPAEMEEPVYTQFDPNDEPIVSLVLSSPSLTPAELTRLADPGVTRELRGLPGVADVSVSGGLEREITVNLRPADLQGAGVSVDDVVLALQRQNLSAPVGRINTPLEERSIRFQGRLADPLEFLDLTVAQRGGRVVRLRDVADVNDGTEEQRTLALYNGREAVGIDVKMADGFSTAVVADLVTERVRGLQETLSGGTRLDVVKNSGERVRDSVRNVEETLVVGAVLTVLVVLVFLASWRSTVITGLALPVSVLASFIAVWAFGFTLNTMSLLGISLAIGILIDDAIVVRENIVRHVRMGKDHVTAAHEGTDEIGMAVTATTFAIVAVFIPVSFMGGITGQFFKPFALTIACAVLVSLFVSFSLDPMLSAYWPDPQDTGSTVRRGWFTRLLDRFDRWFERQADRYTGVIGWALDHRWPMVGLAVASFVAAIWLQTTVGGTGFVPLQDRSELDVAVETPPGSSLEYTRRKAEQAAALIRAHPEVRYTYTTVGTASGSGEVDAASIYVGLVPKGDRDASQDELGRLVREEIRRIGGATAYVYSSGFGGNEKQIAVQVRGAAGSGMDSTAAQILRRLRAVPGAVDAGLSTKGTKPELVVALDRALAGSLGITADQVAQSLRPAFAGVDAGDWVDPTGETRDVTVRLGPEARANPTALADLPLVLAAGAGSVGASGEAVPITIPLGQVAAITTASGPARIDHLDRDRVITVGANVSTGYTLGEVSAAVNREVALVSLPAGVRLSQGGQVDEQTNLYASIIAALGLAVLLMYLILVMQFGSFLDPLAIIASLPLSLIGVVLALLVTGDTLNIMSLIGVILLMGIVAKNAILLVDFAKSEHARGTPLRDALVIAGRVRLRPIIMTTVALIAGMVPVALGIGEGADFRAPLGRAVIGGTITSTVLTLLVVPTFYEILAEWRTRLGARLRRRTGPRAHGIIAPAAPPVT